MRESLEIVLDRILVPVSFVNSSSQDAQVQAEQGRSFDENDLQGSWRKEREHRQVTAAMRPVQDDIRIQVRDSALQVLPTPEACFLAGRTFGQT